MRVRGACLAFQAGVARLPGALPGACLGLEPAWRAWHVHARASVPCGRAAAATSAAMRQMLCARTMVVLTARPGRGAQERESGETFNVLNTQLTKGELSLSVVLSLPRV